MIYNTLCWWDTRFCEIDSQKADDIQCCALMRYSLLQDVLAKGGWDTILSIDEIQAFGLDGEAWRQSGFFFFCFFACFAFAFLVLGDFSRGFERIFLGVLRSSGGGLLLRICHYTVAVLHRNVNNSAQKAGRAVLLCAELPRWCRAEAKKTKKYFFNFGYWQTQYHLL